MFRIEFETDNDAFAQGPPRYEIMLTLGRVGSTVVHGGPDTLDGPVRDTNGNTVGTWQYTPDLDDSGDGPYEPVPEAESEYGPPRELVAFERHGEAGLSLDIATDEGKTWLARVTGLGGKYGIEREWIHPIARNTSRSGRTGDAIYLVEDGVYESNEGRRRLGRRYWVVADGQVREVERDEMIRIVEAD